MMRLFSFCFPSVEKIMCLGGFVFILKVFSLFFFPNVWIFAVLTKFY